MATETSKFFADDLPSFTDYLSSRLGQPSDSQDKWLLALREYLTRSANG